MDAQDIWLIAGWTAVHGVGLVAAWISRLSIPRRAERANQVLLGAAFVTIALLAVMHSSTSFQLSLLSATTLGVMVVGAVFDHHAEAENRVLTEVLAVYEQPA